MSLFSFGCTNRESIRRFVFRDVSNCRSNAGIIYELLLAGSGLGVISFFCVADMDFIIITTCLCRRHSFYSLRVLLYDFHNK